jgi:hypothetical protein
VPTAAPRRPRRRTSRRPRNPLPPVTRQRRGALPSDEPGRGSVGRRGDRALDRSGDGSFTTLTSTSLDDGHPGTRSGVTVMMRRRVAVIHLRDALALLCEAGPYQLAAGRSLYRPQRPQRRLPRAAGHVGRGPARREPPGRGTRRRSGVGGASGPLLALPAQHGAGPVRVARSIRQPPPSGRGAPRAFDGLLLVVQLAMGHACVGGCRVNPWAVCRYRRRPLARAGRRSLGRSPKSWSLDRTADRWRRGASRGAGTHRSSDRR